MLDFWREEPPDKDGVWLWCWKDRDEHYQEVRAVRCSVYKPDASILGAPGHIHVSSMHTYRPHESRGHWRPACLSVDSDWFLCRLWCGPLPLPGRELLCLSQP